MPTFLPRKRMHEPVRRQGFEMLKKSSGREMFLGTNIYDRKLQKDVPNVPLQSEEQTFCCR